ncbi:MAG: glycosyltransferase family A protein, partial [Mucilaginibacter sp.]
MSVVENRILSIAVLIPTLNAGEKWIEALQMISNQTIKINRKLIVDSGSSDRTVEEATSFGFEVVSIKKTEFNHGKTRQLLADLAENIDICIFLTQDAILATEESLSNLMNAFDDPEV